MVYHKPSFEGREPPQTRAELTALLEAGDPEMFGRVGTYDVERSGVGFLFLAWDTEQYRQYWDLVREFGRSGVKLYSSSAAILERVADGRFVIGYNILGAYADAVASQNPDLGIILPRGFTVVMSRIALIPRKAGTPGLERLFLDFLGSVEGQRAIADDARLYAIHPSVAGRYTARTLSAELGNRLRLINVGPRLLVYLDQVKREHMIKRWNGTLRGQ